MGSLKIHPQVRINEYTESGAWTRETVQQLLVDRVRERGSQLAIVDPVNKAEHVDALPVRLTWAELDAEVDRLAAILLTAGVRAGDVIGVQLPNTVEQVVVFLASWRIGAIVSPLPVQVQGDAIIDACDELCVSAFVTAGRIGHLAAADRIASVRSEISTLRVVLSYGVGVPDGVVRLGHSAPTATDTVAVAAYTAAHRVDPNDCLAISWTAGTEGASKGVPYAHYESLSLARIVVDASRLTAEDVLLNPFPMMTAAGITGMLLPWLVTGAVLVQHEPFDLGSFLRQIAEEKVTYTAASPAALAAIELRDGPGLDLSTLTRILTSAAPLPSPTVQNWLERYGLEVVSHFGSIEGVSLVGEPVSASEFAGSGACFPRMARPGTELGLVDLRTGAEIGVPDVPGELRIKGPTVFSGYLNPARNPDPFDSDGRLMTGDLFVIAGEQGEYLRFFDRAADVIVRNGVTVSSVHRESLIAELPAVAEAAVVGCPDDEVGERIVAVVVCRPGQMLSLEQLVEHLVARGVDPATVPERLVISKGLPRNLGGRVLKRLLRQEVSRG
ncbi:acyl--CoA ligase [Rhodococcus sp. ABRD24]|uniref:class I adenylate-forming enzyme family protein n=1 Tax=Rhodococcus sp. ABRD24 TaxID=2507582 RepID=UPI0010407E1E|nr:class I adenylate-forming enzyme family protein [Rhodococcus sp. ABRD24]QBJ97066.1 acyl--CoA ligase [Rhodococcus sp. ABRD24]